VQFSLIEGWVEYGRDDPGGEGFTFRIFFFFEEIFLNNGGGPLLTWDSFLNAVVNVKAVLKHLMYHFIMIHMKRRRLLFYPLNCYIACST